MVYCGKPSRGCQMCRMRRIKVREMRRIPTAGHNGSVSTAGDSVADECPFYHEQCDETKPSCNQWYVVSTIPASLDQHHVPGNTNTPMKRQIKTSVSRIQGRIRPHVPQRNPSDGETSPASQQKVIVGRGSKETRDRRRRIEYLGSSPASAHHHQHQHHHHHEVPL